MNNNINSLLGNARLRVRQLSQRGTTSVDGEVLGICETLITAIDVLNKTMQPRPKWHDLQDDSDESDPFQFVDDIDDDIPSFNVTRNNPAPNYNAIRRRAQINCNSDIELAANIVSKQTKSQLLQQLALSSEDDEPINCEKKDKGK
jgi:hypothetical protein